MLLTLSILPLYLFLVNGVTSADFGNNKRVPRRETQVTRTYSYNHPPLVETQDKIPVSIVYDDEKVMKIRDKTEGRADIIVKDENNLLKHARDGKAINLEVSVNHPPSSGLFSYAVVKDKEAELISKPRSRSLKKPVPQSEEINEGPETRTRAKPRRRVQKVRRVKVNKSQLDTYVRDSQITKNKEEKETIATTVRSRTDKPSSRAPPTFKPRSGVRDPVVPIIDSESYVFSHSGTFHYCYEGGDGTKAYERGELKKFNGGSGSAVEGNFSYKDKDGNDVSLTYTADENGYRPVGAHLPTPPPIPIAIQRALDYLAMKTTPEPITERIKTVKKKDLV